MPTITAKPMMKRIALVSNLPCANAGIFETEEDDIANITAKKNRIAAAMPPITVNILIISCGGMILDLNLILDGDRSELQKDKSGKLAIFI
jgi:hypothetical protein